MLRKPKYKLGRRLGAGVHDKCQTQKFALSEARHTKGAKKRHRALSDFGVQFLEKQKIRYSYGITERQLRNYVKEIMRAGGGNVAQRLFEKLESRLDNVIYRLGLAESRPQARQMVSHGHFLVNGRRVKVPSYLVKEGDVIKVRKGSQKSIMFANLPKKLKQYEFPKGLSFDASKLEGKIKGKPAFRKTFSDLNAVLEFYSR